MYHSQRRCIQVVLIHLWLDFLSIIEDAHMIVMHIICYYLMDAEKSAFTGVRSQ